MKTLNTLVKVLTALAAVAGAVYIIATYGDKIVAWAKSAVAKCPVIIDTESPVYTAPAASAADHAEEAPEAAAEAASEATAAEEEFAPVEHNVPTADESDFEG